MSGANLNTNGSPRSLKRKRDSVTDANATVSLNAVDPGPETPATPASVLTSEIESEDGGEVLAHTRKNVKRNVHRVIFGEWQIKTWYFSPYPIGLDESKVDIAARNANVNAATTTPSTPSTSLRGQGLGLDLPGETSGSRFSRPHSRMTDLLSGAAVTPSGAKNENDVTLWVCDKCFKYMTTGPSWELHTKNCAMHHPPGRKVYQRGAHTIWEVDGALQKLYCQNLSLFGKFFIDVKTLFFDCENFMFYLMTDATSKRDHVLAFFSKEKVSYDDYNLACIVTFPPFQKKGYGMLLIEFSYELSRRGGKVGTPERPLSELGSKSYLLYWVSVLVRFFRKVLELPGTTSAAAPNSRGSPETMRKSKKSTKGWDGERSDLGDSDNTPRTSAISLVSEPSFGSFRRTHTGPSEDGTSQVTHLSIKCTLADIARATNLRVDDCTWAMREAGFLSRSQAQRVTTRGTRRDVNAHGLPGEETFFISKEMVEGVAREWGVKKMMMEVEYVKM